MDTNIFDRMNKINMKSKEDNRVGNRVADPTGLQILSPTFTEDKLLRIARMFESKTDYHAKQPKNCKE